VRHVYSKADEKLVNSIFDTEELLKRVPQHMDPIMQHIAEERTLDKEIRTLGALRHSTGWTSDRSMQRVACIPQPVWGMALQIDPDLGINKEKFYAWLSQHPEYDMRGKVGE